jgi:signal transduction histidine kinase
MSKVTNLDRIREEILALFSHELKTPLTLISGWCQVLNTHKMIGKLNPAQAVDVVYSNSLKLKSDIEDILDTNKLVYGTMLFSFENVDLSKLIKRIIRKLRPVMEERNIHAVNLAKKRIVLRTDPDMMQRVIINLVLNAVDFVPKNKGIIKIGVKEDDEQVIFFVMDNGKGIHKKMQTQIFDKLVQEDSSYRRKHSGLGLGLFLCKGIVESLGGAIRVESKLGKGSTFYFTHPKYGNTARFSLLRQRKHMAVSELYGLVEKRMHDQKEQEMIRRLREYVEKIKNDDFLKSLEKINRNSL